MTGDVASGATDCHSDGPLPDLLQELLIFLCSSGTFTQALKTGIGPSTDIQQSKFIRSQFKKGEHLVMRTTHVPDIIAQLEDPITFSSN